MYKFKFKFTRPTSKKALLRSALLVVAFGAIVTGIFLRLTKPVEAAWFDDNWSYRVRYLISNASGSNQTDWQTQYTVDTATLIAAGKMQSNCNDVRLTNTGGDILSYWIEPTTCNTATTKIWAKLPSIPTSGADTFLYYGNPTAQAGVTSTDNVFIKDMTSAAVAWPLDETTATQSYSRVVNPAVSVGRNMIVNGTFDSDTTWTKGTGWTIANGVAHTDGTNASASITQNMLTAGKAYTITYTVSNYVSGTFRSIFGGTVGTLRSANGTFSDTMISPANSTPVGVTAASLNFIADIDNITVTQVNVPGSNPVTSLISDGTMEASGTTSWTAQVAGVISKQATNPHGGSQVLRIAHNGTNNPWYYQTVLTPGSVYRISGYFRGDGASGVPRVGISVAPGGVVTGTNSTTWQPFDVLSIAGTSGTDLYLQNLSSTNGSYAEFDDVTVSLDTGIRSGEILPDNDMETSGTSYWTAVNSTLSKENSTPHGGTQTLRVTYTSSGPYAYQTNLLVTGKTYRVTGYVRGDGSATIPQVRDTNATVYFTGTSSNSWQLVDFTFVAGTSGLRLYAITGTGYAEFDDFSVTEISPLVGKPGNGVTLGSTSNGHLTNAYTFDGTNDFVNIYSGDLNSTFNPDEGTIVVWAKVANSGVWTDGAEREFIYLENNTSNRIKILKYTSTNQLYVQRVAGGVQKDISSTALGGSTGWFQLVMTWSVSSDQEKMFINGVQVGSTQTGLGTWSGNLNGNNAIIGASNTSGALSWNGMINDVKLYSRALSAEEIAESYGNGTIDRQTYTTSNYTGHELLRQYNASVTVGSPASEERGGGPIAYWKFDEGTGTIAADSTSNNNRGTLGASTAAPLWQTEDQCVSGKCLFFDGSNDYVDMGANINQTGELTISAWVKPTDLAAGNMEVISNADSSATNGGYQLELNRSNFGRIQLWWGNTLIVQTSNSILTANKWQHIVAVRSGTAGNWTAKIYLDGKQVASSTTSTNPTTVVGASTSIGRVGAYTGGGGKYKGFIDEPKIFNYAQTPAQIKADYNASKAHASDNQGSAVSLGANTQNSDALSDGLVGYWKMDESSGNLTDSSGNTNTGTVTGTTVVSGKFGNGRSFNGSSDFSIGTVISSVTQEGNYTISGWVTIPDSSNVNGVVVENSISASNRNGISINGTTLSFGYYNGSAWTAKSGTLTTGQLTHVVATNKGGVLTLYLNGIEQTGTALPFVSYVSSPLLFGKNSGGSGFLKGTLDDLRIYNRTLSPAEVSQLYNWAPGPVGYWNFEEGQGSTVSDRSGSTFTGTWTGTGSHWNPGKYGKAGSFDGSSDYVTAGNNLGFDIGQAFTLQAWFKTTVTPNGTQSLISKQQSSSPFTGYNLLLQSATSIRFTALHDVSGNGLGFDGTTPTLNDGKWHHVAISLDGSNAVSGARMYFDGKQVTTSSVVNGLTLSFANSNSFQINGRNGANSLFSSQIDEVKVYNYARTTKQIVEDMNGGHPAGGSPVASQVAYWKFDEGYGTLTKDATPNGLNGTLTGMASPATSTSGWTNSGRFNKGLVFDGNNDYMEVADNNAVDISGTFTISAWVKPTDFSNDEMVIVNKSSNDCGNYQLAIKTGNLAFPTSASCNWTSRGTNSALTAGTWQHVVALYDGTSLKYYINGINTDTITTWSLGTADSQPVQIGGRGGGAAVGDSFKGFLDEVKIYNYALSPSEIKIDYNRNLGQMLSTLGSNTSAATGSAAQEYCVPGDTSACAAPVGEWKFEEGQGTIVNDTSGNANTGTWNGTATYWTSGKFGKAGSFNGTDTTLQLNTVLNYSQGTIEAWIKPTLNNFRVAYYDRTSSTGNSTLETFPSGYWYHISFVYDGSSYRYYVNGIQRTTQNKSDYPYNLTDSQADILLSSITSGNNIPAQDLFITDVSSSTVTAPTTFFTLGNRTDIGSQQSGSNKRYFSGLIDEMRVFNYARTPAQIAWDYNQGEPVAHWKMDECQGTTIKDLTGNGNTGTLTVGGSGTQTSAGTCTTASTAWGNGVTGKYNSSLNFDGTDDYVDLGNPTTLDLSGHLSVSSWFKWNGVEGTAADYIISDYDAGGSYVNFYLRRTSDNDKLSGAVCWTDNSCTVVAQQGTNVLNDTNWHLLTMTYNGTAVKLYLDGNLQTSTNVAKTPRTNNGNISIGRPGSYTGSGFYFHGQIDDTRIHNYALTPTQIKLLVNQGFITRFGPTTGTP